MSGVTPHRASGGVNEMRTFDCVVSPANCPVPGFVGLTATALPRRLDDAESAKTPTTFSRRPQFGASPARQHLPCFLNSGSLFSEISSLLIFLRESAKNPHGSWASC